MSSQPAIQNNELAEEIEAINAIYEPDTITINSTSSATTTSNSTLDLGISTSPNSIDTTIKLQLPNHENLSFVIGFEASYPDTPPRILGTASTGSRGEGKIAVDVVGDILGRVYQVGAVCLFDLINEAVEAFEELNIGGGGDATTAEEGCTETATSTAPGSTELKPEDIATLSLHDKFGIDHPPEWILSDVIVEKKSVFLGRVAHVTSLDQAQGYLDYLLSTDKKVAVATHNISGWRIRQKAPPGKGDTETIIQDCDDDGETAAGGRLLHLMQLMDVWDVVVVVSRWYGGVKLGPDRFRLINAAGKDALIKGGFTREESGNANGGGDQKGKKKGKK